MVGLKQHVAGILQKLCGFDSSLQYSDVKIIIFSHQQHKNSS